jgi:hypothetical protein
MFTATLRGVGSGRGSSAPYSERHHESGSGAKPCFDLCPQLDRYQHPAWNPQAPEETMARRVVAPGGSHGLAVTPDQTRVPRRRNSPWRPS